MIKKKLFKKDVKRLTRLVVERYNDGQKKPVKKKQINRMVRKIAAAAVRAAPTDG